MTNGEKLQEVFPDIEIVAIVPNEIVVTKKLDGPDATYTRNSFRYEWWYAEYKEPAMKNDSGVDCIDRQATLDAILKRLGIKNETYLLEAERAIYQQILAMPSVTPQLSHELDKNSKKFEKDCEPDCISRADLYNKIRGIDHYEETEGTESDGSLITYHTCDWNEVLRTIEDAPSVTLQPTNNDSGAEYISREELMVILSDYYDTTPEYRSMLKEIASLSSITLTLQEPKSDWEQDHAILKAHSDGANEVLDKIRAEIEDLIDCPYDKCKGSDCIFCLQDECTVRGYRLMEILNKYNVETENT